MTREIEAENPDLTYAILSKRMIKEIFGDGEVPNYIIEDKYIEEQEMKLQEIFEPMKKIRQESWPKDRYVYFDYMGWIDTEHPCCLTPKHLESKDWEEYIEPAKKVQYYQVIYKKKVCPGPIYISNYAYNSKKDFLEYLEGADSDFDFIQLVPIGEPV